MVMNNMKIVDRNWEKTTFADIMSPAKVILCGNRKGLPVLSITMHDGIVEQKDRFKKVIASHDTSKYKVVKKGQLVIAFPIDEGLIYTQDVADEGIMSPAYNVWDVNYTNFDRRFLGLYFHSPVAMVYYKNNLRGTTQRRRSLPKDVLLSMPIPKPSLDKQKEIVCELDGISSTISLLQSQTSDLDALIQAIFYDMFGDPVTNPKGWDKVPLGVFCNEIKYGTSNPSCGNGKYKYLRMCNLSYDGYLDLTDLKRIDIPEDEVEKCIVRKGDILFNRTNSMELIGKTCMFDKDEPMIIAGYIIRVRLNEKLNPIVMARMFNLPSIKKLLKSMAKGAVNQANINSKELSSIMVPVLPLALQQSFASKVSTIEEAKSSLNSQISEMQTLLAARMQYWFD